jgi:hypothetical protein
MGLPTRSSHRPIPRPCRRHGAWVSPMQKGGRHVLFQPAQPPQERARGQRVFLGAPGAFIGPRAPEAGRPDRYSRAVESRMARATRLSGAGRDRLFKAGNDKPSDAKCVNRAYADAVLTNLDTLSVSPSAHTPTSAITPRAASRTSFARCRRRSSPASFHPESVFLPLIFLVEPSGSGPSNTTAPIGAEGETLCPTRS